MSEPNVAAQINNMVAATLPSNPSDGLSVDTNGSQRVMRPVNGADGASVTVGAPGIEAAEGLTYVPQAELQRLSNNVESLGARLKEVTFDPATGAPSHTLTGDARVAAEREFDQAVQSLIYQQGVYESAMQREMERLAAVEAAQRESLARTDRINSRALEIAEEREAQEAAQRIIAERAAGRR